VNEYTPGSINNTYLNTECGINRVFIRSKREVGQIALTAKRSGIEDATITIDLKPLKFPTVCFVI
jgi:beta-galactosidase